MALIEDVVKMSGTGLLVGLGVAIAAPILLPVVGAVARPVAREAIRGMMLLGDRTKELAAEAREQWGDLVAEAQAEGDGKDQATTRRQTKGPARKRAARRSSEAAA